MKPQSQMVRTRIDQCAVAVLDAETATVSLDELHPTIGRCHRDPDERAVEISRGLIIRLRDSTRYPQEGILA